MSLLDNIFVNLRVLSKIPEEGRISTTGTGQIKLEDTKTFGGWAATGRRKLTGDSRDEAVKVLMQLINDITEISDNIINSLIVPSSNSTQDAINSIGLLNDNSKKCHQLNKLCVMLRNAKKGIVNMHRTTYSDDINITAKLDEIMDKMDQQNARISEVLQYVSHRPPVVKAPPRAPQAPQAVSPPEYQQPSIPSQSPPQIDDESDDLGEIF